MTYIMVDVETDGPIPGDYSMISFGAVVVDQVLDKTFYARLKPISERFIPEALAVSGHSREETLQFADPAQVMTDFRLWLQTHCKTVLYLSATITASTGCLFAGIFIIFWPRIPLDTVLRTWVACTKAWKKTHLKTLNTCAKPDIPIIP